LLWPDNAEVTVNWPDPPLDHDESALVGASYECNPVKADMVVSDAGAWVFAGTGLRRGDHLAGIVGHEFDRFDPRAPTPPDVELLTHSPVVCQGRADYSDMTYYAAPSGAGVFATGTTGWIIHLNLRCPQPTCRPNTNVVRIT